MSGLLAFRCLNCQERLEWHKIEFTRPDTYPDWRLEISCGCGQWSAADFPWIHAKARAAHDEQVGVELETQRRNVLDAALTKGGNLYFETLLQALPSPKPGDGQGREGNGATPMKVNEAKLCLDCDEVFFNPRNCPACKSTYYANMTYFIPPLKEDRCELIDASNVKIIKDPWWWHIPVIGKYFRPFDIAF